MACIRRPLKWRHRMVQLFQSFLVGPAFGALALAVSFSIVRPLPSPLSLFPLLLEEERLEVEASTSSAAAASAILRSTRSSSVSDCCDIARICECGVYRQCRQYCAQSRQCVCATYLPSTYSRTRSKPYWKKAHVQEKARARHRLTDRSRPSAAGRSGKTSRSGEGCLLATLWLLGYRLSAAAV